MGLLEESGLILKAGETVTKRGKYKGKMPKGLETKVRLRGAIMPWKGGAYKKVEWEDVDGEIVLTSSRLLAFAKKGRIKKEIVNWELKVVGVTVKKSRFGKEKLVLTLELGTPKAETTELEVENPSEWRNAIANMASQM